MEDKIIKHGNHVMNNDTDGYMYSRNISEGYSFNSHIHKCFEFIYIMQGKLLYTVENSEYLLSDGDFIMTNPAEFHSFSFPEKGTYERAFLHIYPDFLKDYPELTKALNSRKSGYFNRIPADLVKKYGIDNIFGEIKKYCADPIPETDCMVLACTLQLVLKINQILRDEAPQKPQKIISNKKADMACRFIDDHYTENISLDDIAASVYMSSSHLSHIFKTKTGMTLKTYLNMRRITQAKNLIMEGHKTTRAFSECGFSDYSTFYRAFIKYVGMTPDEFKRMQLGTTDKTH